MTSSASVVLALESLSVLSTSQEGKMEPMRKLKAQQLVKKLMILHNTID